MTIHHKDRPKIAHFGAFDHDSYGDLIFPFIVEHYLPEFDFVHISPSGKTTPWIDAKKTISVTEAFKIDDWDGVLVGGGDIVQTAEGFIWNESPLQSLGALPSLWAGASLLAAELNIPCAWNSPGVPAELPDPSLSMSHASIQCVDYLAVRDELSAKRIKHLVNCKPHIVPDTALAIGQIWKKYDTKEEKDKPLILSLTPMDIEQRAGEIEHLILNAKKIKGFSDEIVLLPLMGWQTPNAHHSIKKLTSKFNITIKSRSLTLQECALEISRGRAYVGNSLHGLITALSYGISACHVNPVGFSSVTKYQGFANHFPDGRNLIANNFIDATRAISLTHSIGIEKSIESIARHFDHIKDALNNNKISKKDKWGGIIESCNLEAKNLLRHGFSAYQLANDRSMKLRIKDGQIASLETTIQTKSLLIQESENRVGQLIHERDLLVNSLSWRLTRPLRLAGAVLRKTRRLARTPGQAISYYGSVGTAIRRALQVFRRDGFGGVRRKIAALSRLDTDIGWNGIESSKALYGEVPNHHPEFLPRVSVIVPNFNHAPYLRQRLDSIYNQTYSNFEVILLDDCSSDHSREILLEYAQRHPSNTRTVFNSENSGGVFNQWAKGFALAKGKLIWMAESDDWCDHNHLSELVRFFRNEAVMLAFCRSDFIEGHSGEIVWTSEAFLSDLKLKHWNKPFIQSAHALVNRAWGVKNIVPNVSSAVFRHPGSMALLDKTDWRKLRLCGDWIFYLNLIRGGLVGYSPRTTNRYRQHERGTSINTQKSDAYYQEHERVATAIHELYEVEESTLERQRQSLYLHWCQSNETSSPDCFAKLYSLDRAKAVAQTRQPNILMVSYAMAAGGGETFPITLANLLHHQGHAVSFLNCKLMDTEPGVRTMLNRGIPLLELESLGSIGPICKDMGIEVVHSHHAWVDITLTHCLRRYRQVRKVITMHGMYELMPSKQIDELLPILEHEVDRIVYTAEKNLTPFPESFRVRKNLVRIDNALEIKPVQPVARTDLGIAPDDFVLCLVSRAMAEKGWDEAIASVRAAQYLCERRLHLILIGEGTEFDRLRDSHASTTIHFLGFKPNIRDYFAMADMGFLPSRFKGESFPLVLIDCLFAGKPVLASAVGEIPEMLRTETGLAGAVFALNDFQIPIDALAKLVAKLSTDTYIYQEMVARVPHAAAKFDTAVMVQKYAEVYRHALHTYEGKSQ